MRNHNDSGDRFMKDRFISDDESDRGSRRGGPRRGPGGHGHGPGGSGGPWGEWGGRRGRPGPPPWVAGLLGLDEGEGRRGPRVRRGDVRSAILDVVRAAGVAEQEINGYQVIQQIAERSGEVWKPSPGSVYPTIQQLLDEGLIAADDERGRRTLTLTPAGSTYVVEHTEELAAVWTPFEREQAAREAAPRSDVKAEIGQVMSAVWQILSAGSERQRTAAVDVLVDTRRKLYGILADGDQPAESD